MGKDNQQTQMQQQANLRQALVAGALAGIAVDSVLFPLGELSFGKKNFDYLYSHCDLDTVKTRLQSQAGFVVSGGFRGVYSGLLSAFIGSAPNGETISSFIPVLYLFFLPNVSFIASLFFVTYEAMKRLLGASTDGSIQSPFIYMTAASCGEIVRTFHFDEMLLFVGTKFSPYLVCLYCTCTNRSD